MILGSHATAPRISGVLGRVARTVFPSYSDTDLAVRWSSHAMTPVRIVVAGLNKRACSLVERSAAEERLVTARAIVERAIGETCGVIGFT
jgi:hypothetical protein